MKTGEEFSLEESPYANKEYFYETKKKIEEQLQSIKMFTYSFMVQTNIAANNSMISHFRVRLRRCNNNVLEK